MWPTRSPARRIRMRGGALPLQAVLAWTRLGLGAQARGVVAGEQEPRRSLGLARRHEQGRRAGQARADLRGARRAMARRRRARAHRSPARPRQGLLRHDHRGDAPLLALPAPPRVRAPDRRGDHRDRPAAVDRRARPRGVCLSRSTIAKHVSVASGIYAWASAPSRRLVPRNPLRPVELPPNDEKPRLRVALAPEAAALLAALQPEDRLPYPIAV
jgi:hypothetical protein